MRPRWQVALFLLTLPVWFVPACAWVGYREAGRSTLKELPRALRYLTRGHL